MPTTIRLDQAIEAITLEVVERLDDARSTGELLEGITKIIYGDRTRPTTEFPAIWMFPQPARNNENSHGLMEDWSLPIVLVSLVASEEPEEGYRLAGLMAARARTVAKAEPRGLDLAYVRDILSTSFDPARENRIQNTTVYSAAAILTVRFNVYEP